MTRRLLVAYGQVISTPPPDTAINDPAALADQLRDAFAERGRRRVAR